MNNIIKVNSSNTYIEDFDYDYYHFGISDITHNMLKYVICNYTYDNIYLYGFFNRDASASLIIWIQLTNLNNSGATHLFSHVSEVGHIIEGEQVLELVSQTNNQLSITVLVNWKRIAIQINQQRYNFIKSSVLTNQIINSNTFDDFFNYDVLNFHETNYSNNIIHFVKTNFYANHIYLVILCNRYTNPTGTYYSQIICFKAELLSGDIVDNIIYTDNIGGNVSNKKETIIAESNNKKYKITVDVDWGGKSMEITSAHKELYTYNVVDPVNGGENQQQTSLKYALIGDSLTYMYDNKYETSYDYQQTHPERTGYVGTGYGRRVCNYFGIPYENHYPQGLNGRDFSSYYQEWDIDHHIEFPENINVWTIFLGENDWGNNNQSLGTPNDYKLNTWTLQNKTIYGAIRKIVDKIRSLRTNNQMLKIIFMTPLANGCAGYGETEEQQRRTFQNACMVKDANGEWQYTYSNHLTEGKYKTKKEVVDAIKWVCNYEHFICIDLFSNGIMDVDLMNTALTYEESGWEVGEMFAPTNFSYMRDGVHPYEEGHKLIAAKVIDALKPVFYDVV